MRAGGKAAERSGGTGAAANACWAASAAGVLRGAQRWRAKADQSMARHAVAEHRSVESFPSMHDAKNRLFVGSDWPAGVRPWS